LYVVILQAELGCDFASLTRPRVELADWLLHTLVDARRCDAAVSTQVNRGPFAQCKTFLFLAP
jgi:hypothetical protein